MYMWNLAVYKDLNIVTCISHVSAVIEYDYRSVVLASIRSVVLASIRFAVVRVVLTYIYWFSVP